MFFKNKTVLITGGTWFLWRALTKEILKQNPHSIRIFSRDEVKHAKMQNEFKNSKLRHLVWNIRDYDRLEKALKWVDYVVHAAALKRLDLIEYNTEESVKTNVMGTLNLVRACEANDVKKVVFVSTDKACSPVNTYGACKFVSERIVTETNYSNGANWTVYTTVRYGNVINSTGSIVPFLRTKIKNWEDFPLTDPRMTRFLITEDQAIKLIFNAFEYGIGGDVFIPKLPSAKIPDLMEAIKEVNKTDNKIYEIGLRPGEKIHEFMLNDMEWRRVVEFKNMYVIPSLIWTHKNLDVKVQYLEEWKKVELENYSSETEYVSVQKIIELFSEYLKV